MPTQTLQLSPPLSSLNGAARRVRGDTPLRHRVFRKVVHRSFAAAARTFLKIDHRGLERLPDGGVVLVANHVTYVDAFVLAVVLRRTPRFVMHNHWYDRPVVRTLFGALGVIPIDSQHKNRPVFDAAFDEIARALSNDELVILFPEGALTPDGEMLEFKKGIEHVVRRTPVPVVPVGMRGLWGSRFSKQRIRRAGSLRRRRITVRAGHTVAAAEVSAPRLEGEVRTLLAAR